MKNSIIISKFSLIPLILIISFMVYVYFSHIDLLTVVGNSKNNYYPYFRIFISTIISLFLLLVVKKKYSIYYFLNLLWLVPLFLIIIRFFLGFYYSEKLDYFLGITMNKYEINQYEDKGWIINEIKIYRINKTDTIYISENPSWLKKSHQLKNKEQSKIVRSQITGYYYVSVK